MTLRQPPRSAGRLLKRLVPTQDHDILLGDLCEEYQRGRSIVWYWLQILAAIAIRSLKDVRANPLVAARAVITGLLAQMLLLPAFSPLQNVLTGAGFRSAGLFNILYRFANAQVPEWFLMIAGGYLATRPAETA